MILFYGIFMCVFSFHSHICTLATISGSCLAIGRAFKPHSGARGRHERERAALCLSVREEALVAEGAAGWGAEVAAQVGLELGVGHVGLVQNVRELAPLTLRALPQREEPAGGPVRRRRRRGQRRNHPTGSGPCLGGRGLCLGLGLGLDVGSGAAAGHQYVCSFTVAAFAAGRARRQGPGHHHRGEARGDHPTAQ